MKEIRGRECLLDQSAGVMKLDGSSLRENTATSVTKVAEEWVLCLMG